MRIVVGMSGGVDSAVSASLLLRAGHEVIGVFMKNWDEDDAGGMCTAQQDWEDVQRVCAQLGIPAYAVSFSKEYWDKVFAGFLQEYAAGRTPNPDVLCNREIKFKAFLEYANQLDADKIAMGHFAQTNDRHQLLKGADPQKEQSYFLYMLKEAQLARAVFPVGGMTKREVRDLARQQGLAVAEKRDSTGICFIGERNFREFLRQYLPAQPGLIRSVAGEALGQHEGLCYYTLGQRKGLGIGGHGDGRSFFVVGKDLDKNELLVAQGKDHPLLYSRGALLEELTWVNQPPTEAGQPIRLHIKCRYRQLDQPAQATYQGSTAQVVFDSPQRAVTPGQSMVFYDGQRCLGGGIVKEAWQA